jgi:transcriptional antiterminator RfaH
MPILARELDLYPEDLLDAVECRAGGDRVWWALYCRPRHEKQLMRRLPPLEVSFYGPLVPKTVRQQSGRLRTAYVPLFAGYVFIFGDSADRYQSLTTSCVSRCLPVFDSESLGRDLRQIRHLIAVGAPLTVEARLQAGTRVRIRSGPFRGLEGVIFRRQGPRRLLVAVNFLQQGASVALDQCEVEPIG